ncbi:hypothetical protein C9374_009865 [Naegleria lovaniensis]|uniref:glutathione-specific gamma-glutamylcyclotransferase n=1 Tax=Naegleria lovaniensis TaxID=51637 RepID=A0AA88GCY2_NAELO|nr:uncharacterized protein C9374_009865 [Naegleria lovaniensis]KAG2375242.1 hypothetical protein C9374_009865 [Naegleria lovaniensis]
MCMGEIQSPVFLFAYGSLIWRAGFPYESSFTGFIKGFRRRFWLQDTFHRGDAKQPGRTLTIVKEEDYNQIIQNNLEEGISEDVINQRFIVNDCSCQHQNFFKRNVSTHSIHEKDNNNNETDTRVWGTCYKIPFEHAEKVIKDLDYRELVAGYRKTYVSVYVSDSIVACRKAIVYYYDPFEKRVGASTSTPFVGPENLCCTAKHIARSFGLSGPNRDYLYRLHEHLPMSDKYIDNLVECVRSIESHYPMNNSIQAVLRTEEFKGTIFIDQGATSALSQRCKNLLACGIRQVCGEFEPDDIVVVVDCHTNKVVAKGFSNFSSCDIRKIQGKNSKTICQELNQRTQPVLNLSIPSQTPHEVVSKSRMILL